MILVLPSVFLLLLVVRDRGVTFTDTERDQRALFVRVVDCGRRRVGSGRGSDNGDLPLAGFSGGATGPQLGQVLGTGFRRPRLHGAGGPGSHQSLVALIENSWGIESLRSGNRHQPSSPCSMIGWTWYPDTGNSCRNSS